MGYNFMDFLGYLTDSYMLPLGGIMISLFVGWVIDKKIVYNQLQNKGYAPIVHVLLRFVCPIAISIVFLKGIGLM
jgi:NSS family neurotransmitter:Na+ symporter